MMDLKSIFDGGESKVGKLFDILIQILIVISIASFSIETIPGLSSRVVGILSVVEGVVVFVFTFEYIGRLYFSENKRSYLFSFYGVVDLISILPYYLSMGVDLRSLRIFRMLRLFRLLKLVRYNNAMRRLVRAFYIAKEEVVVFGVVTIMLVYLAAVGIYYFENEAQPEQFKSVFHSLWWAVTTLTTVGYGDVYPVTVGGKIFTFMILMVGLGIVAVPAGVLSSALAKARQEEKEEKEAQEEIK